MTQKSAEQILIELLDATGPINTFFIEGWRGAYCQLKLNHEMRPVNVGTLPVGLFDMESARREAIAYGRIECNVLGRLTNSCNGGSNKVIRDVLRSLIENPGLKRKYSEPIAIATEDYYNCLSEEIAGDIDPNAPDTLGWRVWRWDPLLNRLVSPSQHTVWHEPELHVEEWDHYDVVRGYAGIHAARMPFDWKKASIHDTELNGYVAKGEEKVIGVVERFGRYVLGTNGWRAEWVIIRGLRSYNKDVVDQLNKVYQEVEVIWT